MTENSQDALDRVTVEQYDASKALSRKPTRYVVIENTPGYLPEDDDPYVTDDLEAATNYLDTLVEEYVEHLAGLENSYTVTRNSEGTPLPWAHVEDHSRIHDLGRNFEVSISED